MIDINNFDNIRPFTDSEVQQVLFRLIKQDFFPAISKKVFPGKNTEEIEQYLKGINSLHDFQSKIIYPVLKQITSDSADEITYSSIDRIQPDKAYLFISNHHDILMDPSILNMVLYEHGINTTQVAIGDNLLRKDWIKDLARLNKSFIVYRTPPIKETLNYTQQLSNYIKHAILDQKESLWIAQREGRAKDGNDITQVSLLKMLAFGITDNKLEYLKKLNFLPLAMSYEYDPCDILKIKELIAKEENKSYRKSEDEDIISMVTGLTGKKGRIHISIGRPIEDEFENILNHESPKEQFISLASCIDEQIQSIIRLWPNNYIAYDLLTGNNLNVDKYTTEEKSEFIEYIGSRLTMAHLDNAAAKTKLLTLYANRVKNKQRLTEF